MLSGPMDFTPGIFDLTFDGIDWRHRVSTTLAKQLALGISRIIIDPGHVARRCAGRARDGPKP